MLLHWAKLQLLHIKIQACQLRHQIIYWAQVSILIILIRLGVDRDLSEVVIYIIMILSLIQRISSIISWKEECPLLGTNWTLSLSFRQIKIIKETVAAAIITASNKVKQSTTQLQLWIVDQVPNSTISQYLSQYQAS